MSAWTAINLEAEGDTLIEVDDTKEIQLEEAFKLYQNALRLHSLGPAHYREAREAYDELFKSDVFKYPEALSEFDHDQIDLTSPTITSASDAAIIPVLTGGTTDNANSFPQLVYLAYKSRAQFEIDTAHALCNQVGHRSQSELLSYYHDACQKSLIDAAAALERDDTDIDLWKRASRVSDVLQSTRVVRFCLESVLAGDEEGQDAIDLSGLDEAYAKGELQDVLTLLEDDLAGSRASSLRPKQNLLKLLKASNDPYIFLPTRPKRLEEHVAIKESLNSQPSDLHLLLDSASHDSIAKAFVCFIDSNAGDVSQLTSSAAVQLKLPFAEVGPDERKVETAKVDDVSPTNVDSEGHNQADDADADSPASFHSVLENGAGATISPSAMEVDHQSRQEHPLSPRDSTPAPDDEDKSANIANLPSRKRSSTAAGMEEPEARTKSKRIKARESMAGAPTQEEEPSLDRLSISRMQFQSIKAADEVMLSTVHAILVKLNINHLLAEEGNENNGIDSHDRPDSSFSNATMIAEVCHQLKRAIEHWSEDKTVAFSSGHTARDHIEKSTGLSLFQKHSKADHTKDTVTPMSADTSTVAEFIHGVNEAGINAQQTLFYWLFTLLTAPGNDAGASSYMEGLWPDDLRLAVMKIVVLAHEIILSVFRDSIASHFPQHSRPSQLLFFTAKRAAEFAETMFEIHYDMYSEMANPASTVDPATRKAEMTRLRVWAESASDAIQMAQWRSGESPACPEQLRLRFLWTSVGFAKVSDVVDKTHVLLCLHDLQNILTNSQVTEIVLPNNAAMPRISSDAIEQEISKVKTLEFFMSVFDTDNSDPEAIIMKLEPILEYDELDPSSLSTDNHDQIQGFRSFLQSGDASLTLFLWKKLQNAYTAISYNTKVVSCLLRSVETICREIMSLQTTISDAAEREMALLRWLRDIDELITKVLGKIADDRTAFDAIDSTHLRVSMSAIVLCARLAHVFVQVDDDFRVGDVTAPPFRTATAMKNFEKCRDRFREFHLRLCVLLYWMIKESTNQIPESFENPQADLILYLRSVHGALGEREYCKYCNKLFVRVAKMELFSLQEAGDVSADIAQVMYDTYGIKLLTGYGDVDHGCPPEPLEKDKKTAQTLIPIVMDYARRLNMKDLLRSELRSTIDKIQAALGQPKPSSAVSFNRRAISSYLKSVINPQRLYQSLRGIGEIETKVVQSDVAEIANSGWYLLLGKMTLAKYRSVKRVNPTPTDDLENAMSFLRQDLEHDASDWESWYRLAQVHDAKIEDNLIWNANKLNDGRAELATSERNAVNAYAMATALAMRSAEDDLSTTKLMNDMFFEFAVRLYSSSRPPLDMEAFSTRKAVRHLSDYYSQTMSEEPLFQPISNYSTWNLAAHLIKKSLERDSQQWFRYYMLGKCLWKMYNHAPAPRTKRHVEVEDVMDAFIEAVTRVPKKERTSDPILEPHFKLVSIVYKLQDRKSITQEKAIEYLQATHYAKGIQPTQDGQGKLDWEAYILAVLKKLQNADKSGWHHRITARAAHVIYDNDKDVGAALGAKHQFTESIFTKNMTMQVWKPENERAGRHYVYTGRYLRFFVEILDKLRDRSNLEQVVRKIRRKTTDFINHTKVWEDAVTVYMDLLRRVGSVPRSKERALFDNIPFDEFSKQSEKLEQWAHDATTTTRYLDIIKDAIEMKKLNNSLMKSSVIDDLIGDAYACMYEEFISQLPAEEQNAPDPKPALPQGTFINMTTDTAPTGDDNLDRMRLNNLLSGQTDGASGLVQEGPLLTGLGLSSAGLQGTGTPPAEVVRVPAPAKPGRAKTITRREVQRKAEAAVGKPPPIKTPTLTKRSISVNIPSIKRDFIGDNDDDEDGEGARDRSNDVSRVTSRRGSISMRNTPNPDDDNEDDDGAEEGDNEDEGDDENEASETDMGEDTKPRKRLFPGLAAAQHKNETEDDDEEEDGDGDGESGDEKISDVQEKQEDDGDGDVLEIPESQEVEMHGKHADDMDTD